jgi:hypothetical protein
MKRRTIDLLLNTCLMTMAFGIGTWPTAMFLRQHKNRWERRPLHGH